MLEVHLELSVKGQREMKSSPGMKGKPVAVWIHTSYRGTQNSRWSIPFQPPANRHVSRYSSHYSTLGGLYRVYQPLISYILTPISVSQSCDMRLFHGPILHHKKETQTTPCGLGYTLGCIFWALSMRVDTPVTTTTTLSRSPWNGKRRMGELLSRERRIHLYADSCLDSNQNQFRFDFCLHIGCFSFWGAEWEFGWARRWPL